jgi:hypothetical protein
MTIESPPLDEWQAERIDAFFTWLLPQWHDRPMLRAQPSQRWLQYLALQWWGGAFAEDGGPKPGELVKR